MARTAVKILNLGLGKLFDLLVWPFRSLDPIWALLAISLLAGVMALWIFGKVSDQERIRRVRDRIRGNVIGIRLFGDDIGLLLRLQGRILWDTLVYMRYALVPTLVLIVPFLLILTQANLRFSVRPLQPGEATVVKARLAEDPAGGGAGEPVLEVPEGLVVETPGVTSAELREMAWRVRAEAPGTYLVTVRAGGERVAKQIVVGGGWGAVSPLRTGESVVDMLLYPGEIPIAADSVVRAIEVSYPDLPVTVFGWRVHWLIILFAGVIVFAFAFRGMLGVEI
jgi:hypothetical protein